MTAAQPEHDADRPGGGTVVVSSAQRSAARAMLRRSAVTGRRVSDSVRKIAEARLEPAVPPPGAHAD